MKAIKVSKKGARQFLITKLGLGGAVDQNVATALRYLECVQLDPVAIIERNHHFVFFNRLKRYERSDMERHLRDRGAFEYFANAACLIPMEDFPLFKAKRKESVQDWNDKRYLYKDRIQTIYDELANRGPLPSKAFASDKKVVGAWDRPANAKTKETSHVLRMLFETGEIQVCGRHGSERYFALSQDVIPDQYQRESEELSEKEANERLVYKYLRAYRLIDGSDPRFGWQRMKAAKRQKKMDELMTNGTLIPVEIEDVSREYAVLKEDVDELIAFEAGRQKGTNTVTFLPPLDNIMWRRERIEDLFDFTYRWEIYIPPSKRRYGPYTLPILMGDQLIGRADPWMDRAKKVLTITIHEEGSWSKTRAQQVERAAIRLGKRLGAADVQLTKKL
ncbi:hypothetical protein HNR44_003366 [Geomicrobium halophilum]|uniref:Winged helix DNA-binding domain-containing protein n=1 Tax=Geomicrobium halophilum TaxID=549000 RepID=A0A841PRF7_9BACL|nr:crosslink repair DNA glycosylase YcaQ family protein [Geomicrobium halophilum]MBB6451359.1 hypothetical protein [Geomicrobium halophilum]